jgi:hypothetical protein
MVFFLALGIRYSTKVQENRSAFMRWRTQVLDMGHGVDISRVHNYPNPPVMAVILEPLAKLPPLAGALAWFFLKAGMALLALHWIFKMVEDPERPFPLPAKIAAVMLALKPIVDDLNHGNVNLFIFFLVVGALTAYRRRQDLLAGVVLGLAIACKVTPALFIPYFLWKKAWKVSAGCLVGLLLFLYPGVVPALRLGKEANQKQLASWYDVMVYPFVVEGKVTSDHNNQSLPGLVARLATHQPSFAIYVDNIYTPDRYDNFFDWTKSQAKWFGKGLMGLFALLVLWTCRTATEPRQGWRLAAEYSMVCLGMLLFSERTWKHHCAILALPFAVICYVHAVLSFAFRQRLILMGSLAAVILLMAITGLGSGKETLDRSVWTLTRLAKEAEVYGAYASACLILLANMVCLLRWQSARTSGAITVAGPTARAA